MTLKAVVTNEALTMSTEAIGRAIAAGSRGPSARLSLSQLVLADLDQSVLALCSEDGLSANDQRALEHLRQIVHVAVAKYENLT